MFVILKSNYAEKRERHTVNWRTTYAQHNTHTTHRLKYNILVEASKDFSWKLEGKPCSET